VLQTCEYRLSSHGGDSRRAPRGPPPSTLSL
jgi:hypothetical protein